MQNIPHKGLSWVQTADNAPAVPKPNDLSYLKAIELG
jgi:hypothetical protein